MNAAVIVFPGSNCDRDVATALEQAMGKKPIMAWHGNADLPQVDLVVLPGGFSYGDYLRCGAMAAQSPVMREVVARARAGTPVDETRRVTAMSRYPISLDRPVGNSEDSHFGDLLPDTGAEHPAVGAAQEMLRNRIAKVLKSLSYREREIIKLRYGLGDGYSYTLEEVGHIFKVTRERIRQIEAKAVRKLQAPARSEELSGFID